MPTTTTERFELGIDSFVETSFDPAKRAAMSPAARVRDLLEEIELADRVGLDVFGIGEHHRKEYVSSAPAVILAAAAARTQRIRLASAVTVLSSDDPVRVFQDFATLDLISNGRAEIIVGRGSFIESYPLFGYDLEDYDTLFSEKLDLLLKIRAGTEVHWSGKHRPPLTGQGVYPRPVQNPLPVRIGVGGTPQSVVRAGMLGLPLVLAIIGGEPHRFRPLLELYREAGRRAGHSPENLAIGIHVIGFVGDDTAATAEAFFPSYAAAFTQIGRERGWGPVTREQFDALRGPGGALVVGDPATVAGKIRRMHADLGGFSRLTMLLNSGEIPHAQMLRAVELLGTEVAPRVRAGVAG
ncbi:MAG TPA: LLM class flavin-dependent oxidoreductase [Lacunisphaera sp.]|jgi:probable LLM family oxidoreductase|nr:LLM class flavin-dependent oxidoreductase [Lacunisphaera sp.]